MNTLEQTKPQYAPEKQITGGDIAPGGMLDLTFTVTNPGQIQLLCFYAPQPGLVGVFAPMRLELYPPQASCPVATRMSQQEATLLALPFVVEREAAERMPAGLWRARVTYFGPIGVRMTLMASFPGARQLTEKTVTLAQMAGEKREPFFTAELALGAGAGQCHLRFPQLAHWQQFPFTLPTLERTIALPSLPELALQQCIGEMVRTPMAFHPTALRQRSNGPVFTLAANLDGFVLDLSGSFAMRLRRFGVQVELDLTVRGEQLSYSAVQAKVHCTQDLAELPEWLAPVAAAFAECVQQELARAIVAALGEAAVHAGITALLQSRIGRNGHLAGVISARIDASDPSESPTLVLCTHQALASAA